MPSNSETGLARYGEDPLHAELPLVESIDSGMDPERAFLRLVSLPNCLFLDSALADSALGRYSFLAADPFAFLVARDNLGEALARFERTLGGLDATSVPELPPFQGGAAGLFGYDLAHAYESLPTAARDEFRAPRLAIGLYDVVVAFDHTSNQAWLISQGWPETDEKRRVQRAHQRLQQFKQLLNEPARPLETKSGPKLPLGQLAPYHATDHFPGLVSNFSADEYCTAVRRSVEYIHAGDAFQVNLSQRLLCPANCSASELYLRLRQRNPATFAGYFDLGDYQVVSASPERFLEVQRGQVESRPIKGTTQRTTRPEADLFAADELLASEKDRSENVMIVDLMRNDLSRVCDPETVQVTQLCELEVYAYVQHLVSAVRGRLQPGVSLLDLIAATFPAGSITGAPKIRAMEIISELEGVSRGPYCGSLGYLGADGSMDLSVLIRTITAGRGWWQLPVGGGIVAQSDPAQEYAETWYKAEGLIRALRP